MSQFTKPDYIWFAQVWAEILALGQFTSDPLGEALDIFADRLELQSSGFNRQLFLNNVRRLLVAKQSRNPQTEDIANG